MKIPTSWHEITIAQYQEIVKLDKSDELDYLISLVSVVCHMEVDEVEALTLTALREIGAKLAFIQTMPEKFVNDFTINGVKYIVDCNIAHISAGQYIDLAKYIETNVEDNLHKILSIFCLPTKRKWLRRVPFKYGQGYDLGQTATLLLQTPISVAYPLALFFCKLLNKSIPAIEDYLAKELKIVEKQIAKQQTKEKKHLKNIGVGL